MKTAKQLSAKERSYEILFFLKGHELISRNKLCLWVGYDPANLDKAMNGKRDISSIHLPKFEKILKRYGFTKK